MGYVFAISHAGGDGETDPRAFAEFMADRQDEAPRIRLEDEDAATLGAINEGIADAQAGRTVPAEEARETLRKWTSGLRK